MKTKILPENDSCSNPTDPLLPPASTDDQRMSVPQDHITIPDVSGVLESAAETMGGIWSTALAHGLLGTASLVGGAASCGAGMLLCQAGIWAVRKCTERNASSQESQVEPLKIPQQSCRT